MKPEREEGERVREGERQNEKKRGRQNKEPLMKQTKRIKILSAASAINKWPAKNAIGYREWIVSSTVMNDVTDSAYAMLLCENIQG